MHEAALRLAVEDAREATRLAPTYAKGYYRSVESRIGQTGGFRFDSRIGPKGGFGLTPRGLLTLSKG